jgi:hypothetical protein
MGDENMNAAASGRLLTIVGRVVDRAERCPTPAHTTPECPAFRALAVALLKVADDLDAHAARLAREGVPSGAPAPAAVVERKDRTAGLLRAAEDIRGAITDTARQARNV